MLTTTQFIIFLGFNLVVWLLSWELHHWYFKVRIKAKKKLFVKRIKENINYHQQLADVIIEREPFYELN